MVRENVDEAKRQLVMMEAFSDIHHVTEMAEAHAWHEGTHGVPCGPTLSMVHPPQPHGLDYPERLLELALAVPEWDLPRWAMMNAGSFVDILLDFTRLRRTLALATVPGEVTQETSQPLQAQTTTESP